MNTQTLYLIRGLPGAGKTTLAHRIAQRVHEADQFFIEEDGSYLYRPERIKEAHKWCQANVRDSIAAGLRHIAVANTFTRRWELELYFHMGIHPVCITVETVLSDAELAARCIHDVPAAKIAEMRARWEQ